ncbi:MAG: IS110 family transposase [Gammaproteobacteria bacterium]|nr:IS110 family transposase [Gammaproteobacteria bacterium]
MNTILVIGIDLAKSVIHAHAVDSDHRVACKKKLTPEKMLAWLSTLSPCLIGIEACGGSNYWFRKMSQYGHTVKLISPQFVKPYVKSNKNDANDAEAICEAVIRPNMRFVSAKSLEQQDIQSLHRIRTRLVGQRTALANQIRGLLNEYGFVFPQGINAMRSRLPDVIEDAQNELTPRFRHLMQALYDELVSLDAKVKEFDDELQLIFRQSEACQRIGHIPGIGKVTATALVAAIGDPAVFENGRQMAAWLGLVPRQFSTGGKTRLGGISKRGDKYLRTLLVHGGRAVLRTAAKRTDRTARWAQRLQAKKGPNKAAVAIANKNARIGRYCRKT